MQNVLKKSQPPAEVTVVKRVEPVGDLLAQKYVGGKNETPKRVVKVVAKKPEKSSVEIKQFRLLPTLILALIFYGITARILFTVYPDGIKNFLVNGAFLPFLVPAFLGNFFFFSFLFVNTRRGFLASACLTLLLFLQLQQVLTLPVGAVVVTLFLFTELLLTIVAKKG